jgi:DNA mismatch repair protein MutH
MSDIVDRLYDIAGEPADAEIREEAAVYIVELRKKWEELVDAKWKIERLRALNAELMEALRPFASRANAQSLSDALGHITREDLLRARVAITKAEEK